MLYKILKILILAQIFCQSLFCENTKIIPESKNPIIKFDEEGLSINKINFYKTDGVLFILNDTKSALASIEVEYGENQTHCASSNLEIVGKQARSKSPLGPKDFAILCFPNTGTYPFKILGVNQKIFTGEIQVK